MSSHRAKKRRLGENSEEQRQREEINEEIKKYVEKVNLEVEEGCYGTRDLLENCNDQLVVQKRAEKEFKMFPLLYNGKETGYAHCNGCVKNIGRYNKQVFLVSQTDQPYKLDLVKRHLTSWHMTDQERREKTRKKTPAQPPISDFLKQKKLRRDIILKVH